jgi:sugar phosphate isomerase/epimerase
MDRRKDVGRSAKELDYWFEAFPKAQLCLDLAHAHQFDRTMTEAFRILRNFNDRVCQIHVSELDSTGHHYPLSYGSMRAFAEIRTMIPTNVAIIVESLSPNRSADDNEQVAWIQMELDRALEALSNNEVRVTPNEFVSPRSIPT